MYWQEVQIILLRIYEDMIVVVLDVLNAQARYNDMRLIIARSFFRLSTSIGRLWSGAGRSHSINFHQLFDNQILVLLSLVLLSRGLLSKLFFFMYSPQVFCLFSYSNINAVFLTISVSFLMHSTKRNCRHWLHWHNKKAEWDFCAKISPHSDFSLYSVLIKISCDSLKH